MATNPPLVDWSELISDVLSLIYKRLSFTDFARARTVCSSWYYVSRSRENDLPWLIFRQDMNWNLFNLEEGEFYVTQISSDLGRSLASCGRWVLAMNEKALNIFNPFTSEIIHLPHLESYTSVYEILDNCPIYFDYGNGQRRSRPYFEKAVLWVDEITKDYLVVCRSYGSCHRNLLYFCMKGDEKWIETPEYEYLGEDWCVDMAYNYKDKKLYILSDCGSLTVLDFSQGFPREVPSHPYVNKPFDVDGRHRNGRTRMKVTASGDVVLMIKGDYEFQVYKMNNTNEEWERVDSMEEEEAFFWDLSVTLPTKGVSGIKKDTIYFCGYCRNSESSFLRANTYEIPTQKIERFVDLNLPVVSNVRWLLPCFGKGLANRDKVDTIDGPIQVPSLKGAWTKKLNFTTSSMQPDPCI